MDIKGINQIQTNSEIDSILPLHFVRFYDRPNVIMIGEIRDTETPKFC